MLVNVFDGDKRLGEEVAIANGCKPGGLGGETDGVMEVSDGVRDAREIVDVVYGLG